MPGKFGLPAATAFVTGAVAVLVFHQPALALLHAAGLTPFPAYPTRPTSPLGSPARSFPCVLGRLLLGPDRSDPRASADRLALLGRRCLARRVPADAHILARHLPAERTGVRLRSCVGRNAERPYRQRPLGLASVSARSSVRSPHRLTCPTPGPL